MPEDKIKRMNINVERQPAQRLQGGNRRPRREHDRHPDEVHRRLRQQAHAGCPKTGEEGPLA